MQCLVIDVMMHYVEAWSVLCHGLYGTREHLSELKLSIIPLRLNNDAKWQSCHPNNVQYKFLNGAWQSEWTSRALSARDSD